MSRPINREKYESKRASIVSAASIQFATHGYQGSTTASICSEAGISSGTFFHYFPTKLDALVAVLESGCEDMRIHLAGIEHGPLGLEAIVRHAAAIEAEISQDDYPIFVAGLTAVESEPRVAAALSAEAKLVLDFLTRNVEAGQLSGEIRQDAPAPQLANWVSWLLDGAAQAAAVGPVPPEVNVREGVRAILASPL